MGVSVLIWEKKKKERKCSKGVTTPIVSHHLGQSIQVVVALIN